MLLLLLLLAACALKAPAFDEAVSMCNMPLDSHALEYSLRIEEHFPRKVPQLSSVHKCTESLSTKVQITRGKPDKDSPSETNVGDSKANTSGVLGPAPAESHDHGCGVPGMQTLISLHAAPQNPHAFVFRSTSGSK